MSEATADEHDAPRYCMRHPKVETLVSCAGCGGPICTRCLIATPVGYKCRDCAQLRRPALYSLSGRQYARVIPGAIALALAMGYVLSFSPFLGLLGGIIVGVLIGAALRRLSGYKRGLEMEVIASATVVLAVVSGPIIYALRTSGAAHPGPALQIGLSTQAIGANALGILAGIYIAVQQLR